VNTQSTTSIAVVIVIALGLAACSPTAPQPTATAQPTDTPQPTNTPLPTSTPIPPTATAQVVLTAFQTKVTQVLEANGFVHDPSGEGALSKPGLIYKNPNFAGQMIIVYADNSFYHRWDMTDVGSTSDTVKAMYQGIYGSTAWLTDAMFTLGGKPLDTTINGYKIHAEGDYSSGMAVIITITPGP